MDMEYERIETLATVQGFARSGWDALGEVLLLEVLLGHADGPLTPVPVGMSEATAQELLVRLLRHFGEKDSAATSTQ
jgi:hypothetical protein